MTDSMQELTEIVTRSAVSRTAMLVSSRPISIEPNKGSNKVYVLDLAQGTAAGGRAGGFGERRISRIRRFLQRNAVWTKTTDIGSEAIPEGFEPPHHAAAMAMTLELGHEVMVVGVVDEELVSEYDLTLGVQD